MSENCVFQVLGGNLQMVTHKNVLVDELPLKYDAGNHLGVITHKIAAFVSPIEHMFFGFIVIQSFPSFSETTHQKTLGRMLHVVNPGSLSGVDWILKQPFNLGPKKILPTERLIAARHQRHEPPFRVTFNFMPKNYWKIWGNPPGRRKIIDIMSDINFFCLSRLRRPTLGWKPAGFFVGMGWPSHFDIRVMCWNETIQSWYN